MSTTPHTQEIIRQEVSAAQQSAWVKLAEAKNSLVADLTARELKLQGMLLNIPDDQIPAKLAEYRKEHGDMCDKRKSFTSIIADKLITPLMEYEKRADPKTNAAYISAAQTELENRKAETAKLEIEKNKASERAAFKAHFQNEYMAIAAKYRHDLKQIIHQCYQSCLEARTPPDEVESAIAVARLALLDTKVGQPSKFNRVYLQPEEAAALYKQLPALNKSQIFEDAQMELTEKFSMYANDLANAEVAAKNNQLQFEATIVEEVKELKQEQAANVLMASAESFVLPPSDFKPVTTQQRIIIEDNSEGWIVKVMSAFLGNFAVAFSKTRNKKYSSLTVAQMAAALDAAGIKVDGVQYTTVEK